MVLRCTSMGSHSSITTRPHDSACHDSQLARLTARCEAPGHAATAALRSSVAKEMGGEIMDGQKPRCERAQVQEDETTWRLLPQARSVPLARRWAAGPVP